MIIIESAILKANILKWKVLPAGKKREDVTILLKMNDKTLLNYYDNFISFWQKERGWEYKKYSKVFSGKKVLEIGSGLGYDGIVFSRYVKSWTFTDIIPENIEFIKRIAGLMNIENVNFQLIENIVNHEFGEVFDGFYAHGVLHHLPFQIAKKEVRNIDRFLARGAMVVLLMYPIERWIMCGKPDFEEFGCMTDGEGTPWAEYYDEEKVYRLLGPEYELQESIKWGYKKAEFVNFELSKSKYNELFPRNF